MQKALAWLKSAQRPSELAEFYESHRTRFLVPRPAEDFGRAVARGQHFYLECNGTPIAATGVFDYGEGLPYVELSETFVVEDYRGFGIQGLFLRLRVASTVMYQGPEAVITAAVDPANERSLANAAHAGFERWAEPRSEVYASCSRCPYATRERACCCDFYRLPTEQARIQVGRFLEETAGGVLRLRRRSGDELGVPVAGVRWVTNGDQREALRQFSAGTIW